MQLEGKTAIVTGAARGVGRAIAIEMARRGASLALLDIAANIDAVPYELGNSSQLQYTASECRKSGSAALVCQVDVRDLAAAHAAVATTLDRYGRIDVLVNSAGIAAAPGKIVHDIEEHEWSSMLDVDLSGAWRMTKAVGATLLRQRSGSIVNVSSTAGVVGYRHFAAYVAAKHGLLGLTRAAALDYAPYQVRVNAVLPGFVRDDAACEGGMLSHLAKAFEAPVADHESLLIASPGDIACAVAWLASDDSHHVTGTSLTVDGGFTAR